MELWGVIFGGIGGIAGLAGILYAHIAYRSSKESGKAATDANNLARDSNDIAKDAKRLAEEANEISHRSEQREIERHDVYWEGDWREPGVYLLLKRGADQAHNVVATVTADQEEQTKRAELITEEGHILEFEFPGIAAAVRREYAAYRRQIEAAASRPSGPGSPFIPGSPVMMDYHSVSKRVEWSTTRGTPKIQENNAALTAFNHFYPE